MNEGRQRWTGTDHRLIHLGFLTLITTGERFVFVRRLASQLACYALSLGPTAPIGGVLGRLCPHSAGEPISVSM